MSQHDTADVALVEELAADAETRNDHAAARRLRAIAETLGEHVEADGHECDTCPATFETQQALAGHTGHCDGEEGDR